MLKFTNVGQKWFFTFKSSFKYTFSRFAVDVKFLRNTVVFWGTTTLNALRKFWRFLKNRNHDVCRVFTISPAKITSTKWLHVCCFWTDFSLLMKPVKGLKLIPRFLSDITRELRIKTEDTYVTFRWLAAYWSLENNILRQWSVRVHYYGTGTIKYILELLMEWRESFICCCRFLLLSTNHMFK